MERLADISKFESLMNSSTAVENGMGRLKKAMIPLLAGSALAGGALWKKSGDMIDAHDQEYNAAIQKMENIHDINGLAEAFDGVDWNNLSSNDRVFLQDAFLRAMKKLKGNASE